MRDLLCFQMRILDGDGYPVHGRASLIARSEQSKIAAHLSVCPACKEKAVALYGAFSPPRPEEFPGIGLLKAGGKSGFLRRGYLAAAALLLVFLWWRPVVKSADPGMVVRSNHLESLIALGSRGGALGSVKMAPFTVMNLPQANEEFRRVRLSEGAAEITIQRTSDGFLDIHGDQGSVRIYWVRGKAANSPLPPLRFWIIDRDETTGAPDFFVRVTQGTMAISAESGAPKNEFRAGDIFTVDKNSLIATAVNE
jgi:hypothetical protein